MNNQVESAIKILHTFFKQGYFPSRDRQSYGVFLPQAKIQAQNLVNCMAHACFNLTNAQLNTPAFQEFKGFYTGGMVDGNTDTKEVQTEKMLHFIKEVGLKVEECDPDAVLKDFRSWKVGLYFRYSDVWEDLDYHYCLQEKDNTWSSKFSSYLQLDHFEYLRAYMLNGYEFEKCFIITNPNADENNQYVKEMHN